MNQRNGKIKIAAMGDLHVRENSRGIFRRIFSEISDQADVLILCGDLTNLGLPAEAEVLAENLSACQIPVLGVPGNHDFHSGFIVQVKKILSGAGLFFLDEDENYRLGQTGFAGVKGFGGGFRDHILGFFGEEMIKNFVSEAVNESLKLENSLRDLDSEKKIVVMHYSPIPETLKGESPEIYPFLGSSRLAEAINNFDVDAVFHGHSHFGSFQGKTLKGIQVYNCCAKVAQKEQGRPYLLIEI